MTGFVGQESSFDGLRADMVETQLKLRGIVDPLVLGAMGTVPREAFIPKRFRRDSYKDGPLPIGQGQTISQPYMVAVMTESLELRREDRVLEIGTGSGYQTAVLLEIVSRACTIERIPELARQAQRTLASLGYAGFHIRAGDGTLGWPEEGPFNAIIVTSGAPRILESLKNQLADGGRLVIPAGTRHTQMLYKITRTGSTFIQKEITACVFVPLIGRYGWEGSSAC